MIAVVFLAAFGLLASCKTESKPVDAFTVINQSGKTVRLGDDRKAVEKLLGPQQKMVLEFEEDGVERVTYRETPEVSVDFKDGMVSAIRLKTSDWKLASGFTVGSSETEILKMFDKAQALQYPGYNGLWMSLDSEGKQIAYDEDSAYQLRFDFEDGRVKQIMLQNNAAPDKPGAIS